MLDHKKITNVSGFCRHKLNINFLKDCLPSPIGFRVLYSDIHTLIYKNRFNGFGAFYITYIHIKSNSLHISAKKIVYPPQVAIYSKGPAGKKHMGLMGIYVKMDDTMLNGRPVYEMKGGKFKLFFIGKT